MLPQVALMLHTCTHSIRLLACLPTPSQTHTHTHYIYTVRPHLQAVVTYRLSYLLRQKHPAEGCHQPKGPDGDQHVRSSEELLLDDGQCQQDGKEATSYKRYMSV